VPGTVCTCPTRVRFSELNPDKVKAILREGELKIMMPKKEIGKKVMIEDEVA
jgi:hypothetical protein